MCKVSVVLPSLNSLEYIESCLKSVTEQTLKDIEIICVDAGSTDGTVEIINKYVEKDSRVRFIHSDKKSYGAQMNIGLTTAQGKYVGVVETDDLVIESMYDTLFETAEKELVDFCLSDIYCFAENENSKAKRKLTREKSYYNRIIFPKDEPEIISFVMGTQGGLYRKDFLENNNIRYNETSGAAYQDNGFWFQCFFHAKRVYFVDDAFYLLRRDNPESSVNKYDKVFAISEEYGFVYEKLKKDSDRFAVFGPNLAYSCFQAYRWNLGRISKENRNYFIKQFTDDFRKYRRDGILNPRLFQPEEWKMIDDIMEDSDAYLRKYESGLDELFAKVSVYSEIIIYGAGMVGKMLLEECRRRNILDRVICFAVSNVKGDLPVVNGVKVVQIDELLEHRDNAGVIVAVTGRHKAEIYSALNQYGFINTMSFEVAG